MRTANKTRRGEPVNNIVLVMDEMCKLRIVDNLFLVNVDHKSNIMIEHNMDNNLDHFHFHLHCKRVQAALSLQHRGKVSVTLHNILPYLPPPPRQV